MNLKSLYTLFRKILEASTIIEGRLFIVRQSAAEINMSNMGSVIADVLDGQTIQKKYPCVVMLPVSVFRASNDNSMSTIAVTLFFLTPDGRTGDGDVKAPDLETNRSTQLFEDDWNEMHQCAMAFMNALKAQVRIPPLSQYIGTGITERYNTLTDRGSDGLNGVQVSFDTVVRFDNCNQDEYSSLGQIDISDIVT